MAQSKVVVEEVVRLRNEQSRVNARLDDLAYQPTLTEQRELAEIQQRTDEVYRELGTPGCPPPSSERPIHYRARLADDLKRFSKNWRDVDIYLVATADARGFAAVEDQVYSDAMRVARDPNVTFRPGQLREVTRTAPNGQRTVEFHGDPLTWMARFMAPARATRRLHIPLAPRGYR